MTDADTVRDALRAGHLATVDMLDAARAALDRLVEERDALAAERDVLQAKVTHRLVVTTNQTGAELIEELRAERDRLREALAFYANDSNYNAVSLLLRRAPEDEHPPVAVDRGRIARDALGGHQ